MPLVNKQIVEATCDVCGSTKIVYEEIIPILGRYLHPHPPEDWQTIGDLMICPKHMSVTIHYSVGEEIEIEDNT